MASLNYCPRTTRNKNGVVYTPPGLAAYVAEKTVQYFISDALKAPQKQTKKANYSRGILSNWKVIDPACGEGELLVALWNALRRHIPSLETKLNPQEALCGIDIDKRAIETTKQKIAMLQHFKNWKSKFNLIKTNAFFPFGAFSPKSGWYSLMKRFNAKSGFDILIANPPWGADIESYRHKLSGGHFALFRGQFDTSDLFIELAMSIVKQNGYFAFIIPDSLFNAERVYLRKLILEGSEVKFIGRFGEKFFKNVNRACAVLICKRTDGVLANRVDCLRLTPEFRKAILNKDLTLFQAEKELAHQINQTRFIQNKGYLFDIGIRTEEEYILKKLQKFKKTFRDYAYSHRGVELSKTGKVGQCANCRLWLPFPKSDNPKCPYCKRTINMSQIRVRNIISSKPRKGYKPLLVGESIARYKVTCRYWISVSTTGINYKDLSIYRKPKIVIRKTGVGLSATIDYTNSLVNQVVYIFKAKKESKICLEVLLAILNSRLIYYYIAKTYGETEWKSHPYLTQSQILDLPLPNLETKEASPIMKEIVKLLKPILSEQRVVSNLIDAKLERLVSKLYGLSRKDYRFIFENLNSTEELLPIKRLKRISIKDIFNPRTQ